MFSTVCVFVKNGFRAVKRGAVAVAVAVGVGVTAVTMAPVAAMAALAPADEALITAGIASSDASFYKLAGAVMIVLAGIWGVKKVIGLLSGK